MAVKLRLRREGTTKRPFYRVVAADSRSPRDGRFIEILGQYRPLEEPSGVEIDNERALYWLRNGAQPTDAVRNLLRISGAWQEFKPDDEPKRRGSRQDQPRLSKKARARAAEAAEAAAEAAQAAADAAAPDEDTAAEGGE